MLSEPVHRFINSAELLTAQQLHLACCLSVAPGEGAVLRHAFTLTALEHALVHLTLNLGYITVECIQQLIEKSSKMQTAVD